MPIKNKVDLDETLGAIALLKSKRESVNQAIKLHQTEVEKNYKSLRELEALIRKHREAIIDYDAERGNQQ